MFYCLCFVFRFPDAIFKVSKKFRMLIGPLSQVRLSWTTPCNKPDQFYLSGATPRARLDQFSIVLFSIPGQTSPLSPVSQYQTRIDQTRPVFSLPLLLVSFPVPHLCGLILLLYSRYQVRPWTMGPTYSLPCTTPIIKPGQPAACGPTHFPLPDHKYHYRDRL